MKWERVFVPPTAGSNRLTATFTISLRSHWEHTLFWKNEFHKVAEIISHPQMSGIVNTIKLKKKKRSSVVLLRESCLLYRVWPPGGGFAAAAAESQSSCESCTVSLERATELDGPWSCSGESLVVPYGASDTQAHTNMHVHVSS